MPTITDPVLLETANSFEQLADEAFSNTSADDQKIELLNALFASLKAYSRAWKSRVASANLLDGPGCPDGWDACPDGSCVPSGAGCGESLNFVDGKLILKQESKAIEGQVEPGVGENGLEFDDAKKFLTGYITEAASTYFDLAQTEELKQQTRLLLEVAMLDFKSFVAAKATPPVVVE